MAKRKAQNSILFLTTLSVYLGLVLVGGSPSVLAQAALTQKLEISHEFDVEDDLDNKPEGDRVAGEFTDVCEELARLAAELSESGPGRFNAGEFSFDYSVFSDASSLPQHLWERTSPTHRGRGRSYPILAKAPRDRFRAGLADTSAGFTLQSEFHQAPTLGSDSQSVFYSSLFAGRAEYGSDRSQILNSATVGSAEGRIIVVTNLPRASIDEALPKSI